MIYNIDPEPIREPIPFQSRRDRHASEGRTRSSDDSDVPLTRRQLRAVERANEFLDLNSRTLDGNLYNKQQNPGQPILSVVDTDGALLDEVNAVMGERGRKPVDITDQLEIQRDVVDAHKEEVAAGNWDVINALNDQWLQMQPFEVSKEASAQIRYHKIGKFVARIFNRESTGPTEPKDAFAIALHEAAHRQGWMNDEVKKRDAATRQDYKKAA